MSGFDINVSIELVAPKSGLKLVVDLGMPVATAPPEALPSMRLDRGMPPGDWKPPSSVLRLRGFGTAGRHSLPMRLHLGKD